MKTITFTDGDVESFTGITGDGQLFHNPKYMSSLGRHAIVPGMQLLSLALNESEHSYLRHLDVGFGKPVSVSDTVTFGVDSSEGIHRIVANKERKNDLVNCLLDSEAFENSKEMNNSLGLSSYGNIGMVLGEQKVSDFAKAIDTENLDKARLLYALSSTSGVLLEWLSETPELASIALGKADSSGLRPNLPTYTHLSLNLPNGLSFRPSSEGIVYSYGLKKVDANNFVLDVECSVVGGYREKAFEGEFGFKSLPKRVIERKFAKSLE